jgi:hypothetical protein
MTAPIQNNSTTKKTLEARKTHLIALRELMESYPEKRTKTQNLSLNALNAEIEYIDEKIKKT